MKELRDKFARGRILETVKRKEEEEEELSHIPEDLRQFFRNTSAKKESFIDEEEQAVERVRRLSMERLSLFQIPT